MNKCQEKLIAEQNALIEEHNELLRNVLKSLDDVKKGKYKVL